ncbi:MAG: aldehyde ferredoxin oxidoreductase family protein [Candidatus Ranarchaeia archaeon]
MTVPGYGDIVEIDLTTKKTKISPLKDGMIKRFLGGRGFGAYTLFNETLSNIDPLSPDNVLIAANGPFTGTMMGKGTKYGWFAKSPLTEGYMDAYAGGHWGPELKFAGHNMLVIKGAAKEPTYLFIDDDKIEFHDAKNVWGKTINQTDTIIKEEIGDPDVIVACVGPAGENMVRVANIANDKGRHAGRCGGGAVFGSKNLKGVAVRGTKDIRISNVEDFIRISEEAIEKTIEILRVGLRYGTLGSINLYNSWGVFVSRNYQSSYFEEAEKLDGETSAPQIHEKAVACFGCPIGCGRISKIKKGKFKGLVTEGPEHESVTLLGPSCGISDINAITKSNELCNEYGLDTISTGNIIGFAMEAYEKGALTEEDTEGLELKFGNWEVQHELIKKIAYREGYLGEILSGGVKRAAQAIGRGTAHYANHVKGLESPAYHPAGTAGQALGFAISDYGGGHNRVWTIGSEMSNKDKIPVHSPEGKAQIVKTSMEGRTLADTLGFCRFGLLPFDMYGDALTALSGIKFTGNDLRVGVNRIYQLTRSFLVREGFSRADDNLPPRIIEDPIKSGPIKGQKIPQEKLDIMLDDFYDLMGWDKESGIPTQETLKEFDLVDIAEALKKEGIYDKIGEKPSAMKVVKATSKGEIK